jgi:hypothetical protein
MSNKTAGDAAQISNDSTPSGAAGAPVAAHRLSLRREKVKSLRVAAGVRTGGGYEGPTAGNGKGCGNSGTNPVCGPTSNNFAGPN